MALTVITTYPLARAAASVLNKPPSQTKIGQDFISIYPPMPLEKNYGMFLYARYVILELPFSRCLVV